MISKSHGSSEHDLLEIALRAYVPTGRKPNHWRGTDLGPSDWTLIFDTETTTDASQALKFGVYQIRKGRELWEAGYFINPEILTNWEISVIRSFASANNFEFMTAAEFVDQVFFKIGYELRSTIVGFNLPFDISRIAIGHGAARGRVMKGGFSFQLSPNRYWPNLQVKHLSSLVSLIRFTTRPGRIAGRGMRKRKLKIPPRPGYFVDLRTLASALTSRSFNLAGLADFLQTENRKLSTDEHGNEVTDNYLFYAKQDVQVTWECYCALLEKYAEHKLTTPPHRIFSEASIGKAYFKEMNIRSFRELQPDFPPNLIGIIMSTYFGGRAEVHHRRIISQVRYCDFLSMYPTVCTLMGLWKFVIANGLRWRESKIDIVEFLAAATLDDLQSRNCWRKMATLVQVNPDGDILPIRGNYSGDDRQTTIGLNYLHSNTPLWFTLADCIASKILTGKTPRIVRSITFEPDGVQPDLKPVEICGNPDYRIDPYIDDFYCRIIDQRSAVRARLKDANAGERPVLESTQLTLKILANATSYGNFVELNVEDLSRPQHRNCHGYSNEQFPVVVEKSEEPGRYFHPLIATLITGAARLMLAITERLILDRGLDWAFCDTDSMAIAKPEDMDADAICEEVEDIRNWFNALNPYVEKGPLLKLEEANFRIGNGGPPKQNDCLFCFAVSAKRYALFNLTNAGQIAIRKASAHGLGHLLAPYKEAEAPISIARPVIGLDQIGVERWQYDLWHQIIRAALDRHPEQVGLNYHANLNLPAASRYAATTPALLGWFNKHNKDRDYRDQVRPNNFLLAYQSDPAAVHEFPDLLAQDASGASSLPKTIKLPRPVAPYDSDMSTAAERCFDRDTGTAVPTNILKTYVDALAPYPLRPESKFLHGDYSDRGITKRRHVTPSAIQQTGKESNRWEERYYLGNEEGAEISYGLSPDDSQNFLSTLRKGVIAAGQREIVRQTGIARQTISRFLTGKQVRKTVMDRLCAALHLSRS